MTMRNDHIKFQTQCFDQPQYQISSNSYYKYDDNIHEVSSQETNSRSHIPIIYKYNKLKPALEAAKSLSPLLPLKVFAFEVKRHSKTKEGKNKIGRQYMPLPIESMWDYILSHKSPHVHEVWTEGVYSKLIFDIDLKIDDKYKDDVEYTNFVKYRMNNFIRYLIKRCSYYMMNKYDIQHLPEILVLTCHRVGKVSSHPIIHYPGIRFVSHMDMGIFAMMIAKESTELERIEYQKTIKTDSYREQKFKNMPDITTEDIYGTRVRNFRTIYSSKIDPDSSNVFPLVPDTELSKLTTSFVIDTKKKQKYLFLLSLVQYIDPTEGITKVLQCEDTLKNIGNGKFKTISPLILDSNIKSPELVRECVKIIIELIVKIFHDPTATLFCKNYHDGAVILIFSSKIRHCEILGRSHSRNGIYYVANLRKMYLVQKCWDEICKNIRTKNRELVSLYNIPEEYDSLFYQVNENIGACCIATDTSSFTSNYINLKEDVITCENIVDSLLANEELFQRDIVDTFIWGDAEPIIGEER